MIRISFDKNELSLTASGHAGYAEIGRDIVCAGVSSLIFALGGYLGNLDKRDDTIYVFSCEPGNPKYIAAFEMTLCGLEMIRSSFPECIELSEK